MATARREESDVEEDFNPFLSPPPPPLNPYTIAPPSLPPRTNSSGSNNNSSGSAGTTGTGASASSSSRRRGSSRRNGNGANPFTSDTGQQQVRSRMQFSLQQPIVSALSPACVKTPKARPASLSELSLFSRSERTHKDR